MPKAKWGSGDNSLTAEDIDGADRAEVTARYSGEIPPSGMYRFTIERIKQDKSQAGNDMLNVRLSLDGSWKPNHKQYDGCPLWDRIPLMPSTKQRVANFMDAVGGTGKDIFNAIVDEDKYITKFGSLGDPAGILVFVNVKHVAADGTYQAKLETHFASYLPVLEGEDGPAPGPVADDNGGEEPPF